MIAPSDSRTFSEPAILVYDLMGASGALGWAEIDW